MPIYEELPFIASKTQIVLTSCIFPTVVQISRRVKRTTTSSLEENNKKKWSKKDVRQLDSTLTQLTALLDLKGIREFHVTPFVVVFELQLCRVISPCKNTRRSGLLLQRFDILLSLRGKSTQHSLCPIN